MKDRPGLTALILCVLAAVAIVAAGCGHTETSLQTPDGLKLTRSDTQFLRERSVGEASAQFGDVTVQLKDASGGLAEGLRGLAEAIEKAK